MLEAMSDVVYDLVREFLRHGPPASRNQAFEAYQDARFARAARIYQFLDSVRRDLTALAARGDAIDLALVDEGERLALRIAYRKEQLARVAYLRREEWALLEDDPALGEVIARLRVA